VASISRKQEEAGEANKTKTTGPSQKAQADQPLKDEKSAVTTLLDTISEDRKAFMEKDADVQRSIAIREEKIQQLKEKSIKKEDNLSTKAKELADLRERTRRMMEKARAKEAAFTENEQKLQQVLSQDPAAKRTMMDKILARANEKAAQMKAEKQARRLQGEEKGEDDLLSFLRSSHKEGRNIYDYLAPDQDRLAENSTGIETASRNTSQPSSPVSGAESKQNGWTEVKQNAEPPVTIVPTAEPSSVKSRRTQLGDRFMTIYRDFSDTVQTLANPKPARTSHPPDLNKEDTESSAWSTQVEQTIHSLEMRTETTGCVSNGHSLEVTDSTENLPGFYTSESYVHYAERWSLSPPEQERQAHHTPAPPASKLRPLNKPAIIVNGRLRVPAENNKVHDGDTNGVAAKERYRKSGTNGPAYGTLVRRKSLSDNSLNVKSQQQRQRSQTMERELDAFGIPRLPPRPRRSVSLMRETFTNRGREEGPQQQQQNVLKQRAISHETRTSSAAEFKNLFEAGSAGNSTRASRASTPFRPPQVCL